MTPVEVAFMFGLLLGASSGLIIGMGLNGNKADKRKGVY